MDKIVIADVEGEPSAEYRGFMENFYSGVPYDQTLDPKKDTVDWFVQFLDKYKKNFPGKKDVYPQLEDDTGMATVGKLSYREVVGDAPNDAVGIWNAIINEIQKKPEVKILNIEPLDPDSEYLYEIEYDIGNGETGSWTIGRSEIENVNFDQLSDVIYNELKKPRDQTYSYYIELLLKLDMNQKKEFLAEKMNAYANLFSLEDRPRMLASVHAGVINEYVRKYGLKVADVINIYFNLIGDEVNAKFVLEDDTGMATVGRLSGRDKVAYGGLSAGAMKKTADTEEDPSEGWTPIMVTDVQEESGGNYKVEFVVAEKYDDYMYMKKEELEGNTIPEFNELVQKKYLSYHGPTARLFRAWLEAKGKDKLLAEVENFVWQYPNEISYELFTTDPMVRDLFANQLFYLYSGDKMKSFFHELRPFEMARIAVGEYVDDVKRIIARIQAKKKKGTTRASLIPLKTSQTGYMGREGTQYDPDVWTDEKLDNEREFGTGRVDHNSPGLYQDNIMGNDLDRVVSSIERLKRMRKRRSYPC